MDTRWSVTQPHAIKYDDPRQAVVLYDIDPDIDITARIESVTTPAIQITPHHFQMLRSLVQRGGLPNRTERCEQIPQDGQHWLPEIPPGLATFEIQFTGLVTNVRIEFHYLPLPAYYAGNIDRRILSQYREHHTYACTIGSDGTLLPAVPHATNASVWDMIIRQLPNSPPLTPVTEITGDPDTVYLTQAIKY